MILKFALFTLTVSVIPLIMIIKDLTTPIEIFNYIRDGIQVIKFELIRDILSVGVFTYFSSAGGKKTITDQNNSEMVFTSEKLQKFTGKNGDSLYIAILGNVFDVSKGAKYYGPRETYNVFTGRDGSRAFVTGDFTDKGLSDDVEDLGLQELRSLNEWLKFYHKEYTYKGKLFGRYYDENGKPTGYNHRLQLRMEEAERDVKDKNRYKLLFPPCNVEWSPEEGTRVWCTKRSGGIERDWVGVPRKLYEPGGETFRCACINTSDQSRVIAPETGKIRSGNLEEYVDCHPQSTSCYVND